MKTIKGTNIDELTQPMFSMDVEDVLKEYGLDEEVIYIFTESDLDNYLDREQKDNGVRLADKQVKRFKEIVRNKYKDVVYKTERILLEDALDYIIRRSKEGKAQADK